MSVRTSSTQDGAAVRLMAVEIISGLLASTDARDLARRLTEELRELTGARTALLYTLRPQGTHELLYACPERRGAIFSPEDVEVIWPAKATGALPLRTAEMPADQPLRSALAAAGVESLLRFPLRIAGELVGALFLLDLPAPERLDEAVQIIMLLSPPMALALRNTLAMAEIERQKQEIQGYAWELERRVADRTAELAEANRDLSASRLAALNIMEDAVEARDRAEQVNAALRREMDERKRAEEQREHLRVQLAQAQKMESVGRLAGGVAHDFNNMLTVILGHAQMGQLEVEPDQPIHADLAAIEKAARRSTELVGQLLAFARKQTVTPRVLDLNDKVPGILRMLQRLIGEDIELTWSAGPGLWPVKIDPTQIDQVLANLCVNARDAIAGGGKIHIATENVAFDDVRVAGRADGLPGDCVMLTVSDNGCGMDAAVQEHLFEPFFTTKAVGRGTGLGLATVYGIVKQNGGFVDVSSAPGRGTTFHVYLGRCREPLAQESERVASEPLKSRGETILLVEDEAAVLDMTRTMLQNLGYTVIAAGTPMEAIRQARDHAGEFQMLITDVVMPELNGRALRGRIEDVSPGFRCLFVSGYTADVIADRGLIEDGVWFLQKPFSLRALAAKIREVLA